MFWWILGCFGVNGDFWRTVETYLEYFATTEKRPVIVV